MKDIIFKELRLADWRAQSRTVRFNEDRTMILGKNASGKSTTWDAILWLLTGYDSLDRNNYQLFDTKLEPTRENSKPAVAELDLSIDGMDYCLKKVARRGWVRKRGTDSWTKKPADDYEFYMDGVEVPAATYKGFIESQFCSIDKLKFILNIDYYLSLDWRELRKHFADIIGEVGLDDYEGDYSSIIELLRKYGTLDAVKEYLNTQRKPLREAIGDFSARGSKMVELETLESSLPDISGVMDAEENIATLSAELADIDNGMKMAAEAVKPFIDKRTHELREIESIKTRISQERIKHGEQKSKEKAALLAEKFDIQAENELVERENDRAAQLLEAKKGMLDAKRKLLANAERDLERLRAALQSNKELEFNGAVCSFCGQILPEDKLDEERAEFNRRKEEKHRYIMTEGKMTAKNVEDLKAQVAELESIVAAGVVLKEKSSMTEINERIERFDASYPKFEDSDVYLALTQKLLTLEENLTRIPETDTTPFRIRRAEIVELIKEESEKVGIKKVYDAQLRKINELKEEVKAMTTELVRLEGLLFAADAMEKEKAEIVRKRVSALFNICEIEMEERKKDGGFTPACNILVDGVKAQVTNTASKILAGTDIAQAFAKFYELNMPLIVDNRERVDESIVLGAEGQQVIELKRADTDFVIS